jgi:hypothetical protein
MATRERTTGGEIPTSPQAFDYEAARLASVTEQMMDGTPLHQIVTDPPHPDTTVNPKIGEDTIAGAKAMVEFTENAGKTIDVIDEVSTASQIIAEMDAPARVAVEPVPVEVKPVEPVVDVGAAAGQKSIFDVTPESLDRARSEAILDQTPDMTIRLAPDQDVNAKEYLSKMDEEIRLAEADAPLYKVAVACALGRNAE